RHRYTVPPPGNCGAYVPASGHRKRAVVLRESDRSPPTSQRGRSWCRDEERALLRVRQARWGGGLAGGGARGGVWTAGGARGGGSGGRRRSDGGGGRRRRRGVLGRPHDSLLDK